MKRIYYNDIFIDDENCCIEVYKECEYVDVEDSEVDDYIDEKLDWGEWHAYVIPQDCNYKVIFNT